MLPVALEYPPGGLKWFLCVQACKGGRLCERFGGYKTINHGLSQQGAWVPFWTSIPLKRTPQGIQIFLCGISKNPNLKLIIELFRLLIIPMTLFNDIMPYFDEFIHVFLLKYEYIVIPLKNLDTQKSYNCQF